MKLRICSKLAITLGVLISNVPTLSAQTFYGVESASHFNNRAKGNFYIQAGSFKNKSNALRTQSALKSKTHQPVFLKEKNGYYVVIIGPLHSAALVRQTAQAHSQSHSNLPKHKPVYAKKIVKKQKKNYSAQSNRIKSNLAVYDVYQDKDGILPVSSPNSWFVGLGIAWLSPFNTNAINYASSGMPGFPDDRYVGNDSNHTGQYSILAGYQWQRDTKWLPAYSLALQYSYSGPSEISGFIDVNSLDAARNFTYKYNTSQQLLLAKLKLDLYRWHQILPYFSAGAGVTFNRGSNYSDKPIPGETAMLRRYGFNSGSRTHFAGTLGAGLDYWVTNKSQLSLGYEFTYFGTVSTGYGQGVLSDYRLSNKLNSNSIYLQGTYFFN